MPTVLILSKRAADYDRLVRDAALPDLTIASTDDADDALRRAPDATIAFGEPALLQHVVPRMPRLTWVQSTWTGVEPLLALPRRDYTLTNARDVFGGLMSEYVFAYLLARERMLFEKHALQQQRVWDNTGTGSLRAKTIGLMGVGTIGAAIAKTAKHFGMRVKGFTRASEESRDVDEYFHGDRRLEFARDLDYLIAVLPGTRDTRQLIDAAFLRALPPQAYFVNPGRGSIVDEEALVAALREKRIAGAVLDVFQQEPLPPEHPLWTLPNVVITSHTAALSVPQDIAPIFIDNYRRFHRGAALRHVVDFDLGY